MVGAMSWNIFGTTPDPNQNNLAISSEFSQLGSAIKKGSDTLAIVKQIPGVLQTTIDDYTAIVTDIDTYHKGPAASDTLTNINSKRSIFERQTQQFVEKSQGDVKNKVDIDAAVEEKQKEPIDIQGEATRTALHTVYWILFTGFVLFAGSAGSNLAGQLYKHSGAYTLYYFIFTAGLAAAYSIAVSWGVPYLLSYKDSQFARLLSLIVFQLFCLAIFFSTSVSKVLAFRAWLLPLFEGNRGLFSYSGPSKPLPIPSVLPVSVPTPTVHVNHTVDSLLRTAANTSVTGAFSAPATVGQATDLTGKRLI
jgi:hypothetical protein